MKGLIVHYNEHSFTTGADSKAVAYVAIEHKGGSLFGVGAKSYPGAWMAHTGFIDLDANFLPFQDKDFEAFDH